MITTAIFDMDGTLFSTEPLYFQCYQAAAREMGLDFPFELFVRCVGISLEEASKIIKNYYGKEVDVPYLYEACGRKFEQYMDSHLIPPRAGVVEMLSTLAARGLKIGMATSNGRAWAERLLKQANLFPYFKSIVTAQDVSKPKPDPEVYLRAAAQLQSGVSECVAFDDSVAGATAAISAGMRTVVIPDLKQPDSFVRQHAFRIYDSMMSAYVVLDELLS